MNVEELFKNVYQFIIWMNENIFEPLNGSVRIDAFVGIVGILVAIVIFIAETMNDKKVETQKRFVLEKTKMKKIMIFSIIILSLCILKELIPYDNKCTEVVKVIFFIEELLLNIFICCSIWLTIKLFGIAIKLSTNSDYFSNEYDKYIEKRLVEIHNKNISYSNKKLKNESVNKFVKENSKYLSFELNNLDSYTSVKANKSGIFKSYSCRALQAIIDKIEEENRKSKELIIYTQPLIILKLKGGEKINRGVTVAYCKNEIINYEESIRNSCLLNDSIPFQDNEINLILNDLYYLAESNMNDNFDSNSRLFNFYDFMYKNNMRSLLENSYEYIRKIFINCYKDIHKNRELAKFLSSLASLAYINEDYERYKFLSNYIYYCYREQLEITDDIRKTSYDFTSSILRYDYYSIKENSDSIYYDVLLSNLMSFLFDLIIRKEFIAINDLFHNVIFDYNGFIDEDPDSYDIIKLQFSYGFVYGLIILSDKDFFKEEDKQNLKNLIRNIKSNFVKVYTTNDTIEYFKKYYNSKSNVHDIYYDFDFRFENKEYRNSWSGFHIDDISILKEYIYVFGITYSSTEDLNSELISKENKYFYERLLELIKSEEKSKLETILDGEFNKKYLIALLDKLIVECKKVEKEFIKNNELSEEKTEQFKNIIFEEFDKGNELILYLKNNNKYFELKQKNKRLFGFNQIIGRELFFDDVYGMDNISRDYGRALHAGISKEYLKKLDSISEVIKEDFIKYIKILNTKEEYVIIASPSNCRFLNLNNFDDKIVNIDGKKLDLIKIPKAKDIYLINKNHLPKVEMYEPDTLESGMVKNGVYYDLIDCSKNATARNEIQKNTKWLEEKGAEEDQIEYLKGNCIFKLFISPSIRKISNSKCYKFIIKEGEE